MVKSRLFVGLLWASTTIGCLDLPPPALPDCLGDSGICTGRTRPVDASGGDRGATLEDAGSDGPEDRGASPDGRVDGMLDMVADAYADAGLDALVDGPMDAAPFGGDAGPMSDAAVDGAPDGELAPPDLSVPLTLAEECLLANEEDACGTYVETSCRLTLAWTDVNPDGQVIAQLSHVADETTFVQRFVEDDGRRHVWPVQVRPDGSPQIECDARNNPPVAPLIARSGADGHDGRFSWCVATQGAGGFWFVRFLGRFDANDLIGLAISCQGESPDLDRAIEQLCSVHLGRADNDCSDALEGVASWEPRIGTAGDCANRGNYMLARTPTGPNERGHFGVLAPPEWQADIGVLRRPPQGEGGYRMSRDDGLGVAWKCSGFGELSATLQRSAHVVIGWAVDDVVNNEFGNAIPRNQGAAQWPSGGGCERGGEDGGAISGCVSSGFDGLYHELSLPFATFDDPCGADDCQIRGTACYEVDFNHTGCHSRQHALGVALKARAISPGR